MCLDRISMKAKQFVTTEGQRRVGYKLFSHNQHTLNFGCMNGRVTTNRWVKDKNDGVLRSNALNRKHNFYRKGFHIYLQPCIHDATMIYYDFRKVYYKKPVAYGYEGKNPIVVARELFVPRKKRGQ